MPFLPDEDPTTTQTGPLGRSRPVSFGPLFLLPGLPAPPAATQFTTAGLVDVTPTPETP